MRAGEGRRAAKWLAGGLLALAAGPLSAAPANYPTEVLAEYVFACMATNGTNPEALRRCSCSIDHIAGQLTHDEYVQAETVLRMQQVPAGTDQITMFRTAPWAKAMVDKLRRAQVEAELRCF